MQNQILYAISDVHGRADLLESLLGFINSDARYFKSSPVIYFLGDLVDRGLQSRQCLDLVIQTLEKHPGSRFHMGNHDFWFLEAAMGRLKTALSFIEWQSYGGWATLQSYYPNVPAHEAISRVRHEFPHHLRLIEQGYFLSRRGHFVFVHAGIKPGVRLDRQDFNDFLFIRDDFLKHVGASLPIVVHGHTIFENGPIVTENRISIDTGCFSTNRLVACRFIPSERSIAFIEASGSGSKALIETREIDPVIEDRGHGSVFNRADGLFDRFWED